MLYNPPLEYCSLQYAEYWFDKEREIVRELQSKDRGTRITSLAKGAGYFRVARRLPSACDVGQGKLRCEPILDILEHPKNQHPRSRRMIDTVLRVRDAIGTVYGGASLSAASKFLWLLYKDPFVIYDSQARSYLGTPEADYVKFVAGWEDSYRAKRESIGTTCKALPGIRRYLSWGNDLSHEDVERVTKQEWFRRRVHDIFLWEAGGDT